MANKGIRGRIVLLGEETGTKVDKLIVKAVDFDPFFNEDDTLKSGNPDEDGKFTLNYSPDAYSFWKADRNPDIVVQILTPEGRLLWETKEEENVTAEILELPDIKIHRNHLDGWLVTHATLSPQSEDSVALFRGNEIRQLVDGDAVFPAVTKAAKAANTTIRLMNLAFAVDSGLITQFKSDFDPLKLPPADCKSVKEATLEEVLKKNLIPVNVLVANIPLSASDTVSEVRKFFENTHVKTSDFHKGFNILHARAVIYDGFSAILMGSSLKQSYFNDARHSINDTRHHGSLFHDVSLFIAGPAVAQIDKTFATFWKSTTDEPLENIAPGDIGERSPGDNVASVQVLRTLPGDIFKAKAAGDEDLPHGETGILEAYQRAIHNAERFIYLENQYFTSPEIVDALIHRLNDTTKSKLQLIFVLNFRPDLPGYPQEQFDIINKLKGPVRKNGHQIGVYSLWTRDETPILGSPGKTKFEIMPIYIHSKIAIIDDTWATVGTANLDGTSLNYHQIGLMVGGYIGDKLLERITLEHDFGKFFGNVFWMVFYYVFKQIAGFDLKILLVILGAVIMLIKDLIKDPKKVLRMLFDIAEVVSEISDIFKIISETIHARPSQHALPHRSRQPGRNVELNVVIYNGIAGQPKNRVIQQLRERLWQEHLGLAVLPAELQNVPQDPVEMKWVDFWDTRADANREAIKKEQRLPNNETTKILRWMSQSDAELYLQDLEIRTKNLRNHALQYNFKECKVDDVTLFPWPII